MDPVVLCDLCIFSVLLLVFGIHSLPFACSAQTTGFHLHSKRLPEILVSKMVPRSCPLLKVQVSEKSLLVSVLSIKDPPFRDGPRSTLFNVIPFDCIILKWLDFLKGVKKKPLYMHQWSSEAAETAPANGQHIIPAWKFCSSNANFIAVMPPRWCQRNQWTASN